MRKLYAFAIVCACFLSACNSERGAVFNGGIQIVEYPSDIVSLKGEQISFDSVYTGAMAVYDSLMLFGSQSFKDYRIKIFNIKTGELLGKFFTIGRGPGEFSFITHAEQFFTENGEQKLYCYDHQDNVYVFNITRSINSQKTVIESKNTFDWMHKHSITRTGVIFVLDEDHYLIKSMAIPEEEGEPKFDSYMLYQASTDEILKKYTLFNRFPAKNMPDITDPIYYSSDRMKSDGSKLAMAMERVGQLNILDIKRGKQMGYRLKNSIDFGQMSLNPRESPLTVFYTDCCVGDTYIYALYSEVVVDAPKKMFDSKQVHVFDWDGNFVRVLELDNLARRLSLDEINNILYTQNSYDEIYRYDLNN